MNLLYKIKKEQKKRVHYKNLELKQKIFKFLQNNVELSNSFKRKIMFKLDILCQSEKKSLVRFTNICVVSGRRRGVYDFFKLSRSSIKLLVLLRYLPNIWRASW